MTTEFTFKEIDKIQKAIRKKYKKVAKSPDGLFKDPTGLAGLEIWRKALICNLLLYTGSI